MLLEAFSFQSSAKGYTVKQGFVLAFDGMSTTLDLCPCAPPCSRPFT